MLVMQTLYNNLEQRLPIDSNFKLIDIWMMHGLYTPFMVFCVHILGKLQKQSAEEYAAAGSYHHEKKKLFHPPSKKIAEPQKHQCRGPLMRFCSLFVPAVSVCFVCIFFVVAVSVY